MLRGQYEATAENQAGSGLNGSRLVGYEIAPHKDAR